MEDLRRYLELLLDHDCGGQPDCTDCRSLQRVYQFLEAEIFSCVLYSETPLAPRIPVCERALYSVGSSARRRARRAAPDALPPAA
jgi:hypothetical protein